MQEERQIINSVQEICTAVKVLEAKYKQGIMITRISEFEALLKLCFSSNKALKFAASRTILYFCKWKLVDPDSLLGLLASVAEETGDISGVVTFLIRMVLDSSKDNAHNYLRYIQHLLIKNQKAIFSVLAVFDEACSQKVMEEFRTIIFQMLFDLNSYRVLSWIRITDRVDSHLQQTFLHCLKYTEAEDCCLALMSVKKVPLGNTRKCLILSSLIHSQMILSVNSSEAIDVLKDCVKYVDIQTQSIVLLGILYQIQDYSYNHLYMIFDICDWFLDNILLWNEVWCYVMAAILPFIERNPFSYNYHMVVKNLIDKIKLKLSSKFAIKMISVKSLLSRYTIYRHNCLHESMILLGLMSSFSNQKEFLISWLNKLLHYPPKKSTETLITMYFLSGDDTIRSHCLSVMSKWNLGSVSLYLYQVKEEKNPRILYDSLKTLLILNGKKSITFFYKKLLYTIESQNHTNSSNLCVELYNQLWLSNDQNYEDFSEILSRHSEMAALVKMTVIKNFALKSDTYSVELLPLLNDIFNNPINKETLAIALAIDTILILCEKGLIHISVFWEPFMILVGSEKHPAVQKSVCDFLSKIPNLIERSQHSDNMVYRSARLLWHFATYPSFDRASALRSLKEYDLEDFDASFLSSMCRKHIKSNVNHIPGNCWFHLMKESDAVDLFIHFINKLSKKAKFHGNYSRLFHGIIGTLQKLTEDFVTNKKNETRKSIIICLKILSANWACTTVEDNVSFLHNLLIESDAELKSLSLHVVLNLYPMSGVAKSIFENFFSKNQITAEDKAIICFLPTNFLLKQRDTNMDILRDGVYYALSSNDTDPISGEPYCRKIIDVFQSYAKDSMCPIECQRTILSLMFEIWLKVPLHDQIFKTVTQFLARTYGQPFMKTLPLSSSCNDFYIKYIHLSTEVAICQKLMYGFDPALRLGLSHDGLQAKIIKCLLKVLCAIGTENRHRNIKWFVSLLCTLSLHADNYMCQILVHCTNYLSGNHIYMYKVTLASSIEVFPLGIVEICNERRIHKDVILTLNDIVRRKKVDFRFIEIFKLAIMTLKDDPSVPYNPVVKKVME